MARTVLRTNWDIAAGPEYEVPKCEHVAPGGAAGQNRTQSVMFRPAMF